MTGLPDKFLERLSKIVAPADLENVLKTFEGRGPVVIRVNTLKAKQDEVISRLNAEGLSPQPVLAIENAYSCKAEDRGIIMKSPLLAGGFIYIQTASSQLACAVLRPKSTERVLDMCSAPGSKTSQMAALMNNGGEIIALEAVKGRFFKLKNVLNLLGVANVRAKICDARRYRPKDVTFDKILVDAPCSSEGRFCVQEPESYAYWSERKIKEMKRKQKGILLRGLELLRQGGELLYSTCTFAPEENEEVVSWALAKMKGVVELTEIPLEAVGSYPALSRWGKRAFDPSIRRCVRILPQGVWEAFFLARFKRS